MLKFLAMCLATFTALTLVPLLYELVSTGNLTLPARPEPGPMDASNVVAALIYFGATLTLAIAVIRRGDDA